MFKIETDTRVPKHNVLKRVAELAFDGKLTDEAISEIPFEQIKQGAPTYRCCIYKEREIIHQRARLAMGKMPNGKKPTEAAVTVIPAACEGCPIQRYTVTENCQNLIENDGLVSLGRKLLNEDNVALSYSVLLSACFKD